MDQPIDPDVDRLMAELQVPTARAADRTIQELRQTMLDDIAVFTRGVTPPTVDRLYDMEVPSRHGQIPVRIYETGEPTAIVVYLHGGAWMLGDIDTHDFVTRRISRDTGAMVVSVDYPMLPEHPFPAPFEGACDAVVWASTLHPDLPLIVGGDSAGGTLTASIALWARDAGGPRIDLQVLIYPAIDDDFSLPSWQEVEPGRLADLEFYFAQYSSTEAAAGSAYALPGRASSLADLPPAFMAIAGHDVLRSAEEDYVRRLEEAGVAVTVQLNPELTHAWIDYAPRVPSADRAFARFTETLSGLIDRAVVRA
ncbi:acetyl esterase [Marmoricola sp. URHA0025 HA25]